MKTVLRYTLKTIKIILISVLVLVVLISIALALPVTQDFIQQKAVAYLKTKLGDRISIGKVRVGLWNTLRIENIYLKDVSNDTLLYSKQISANADLIALLSAQVNITHIGIEGATIRLKRSGKDSTFNFDYIVQAFASQDTTQKQEPQKEWEIGSSGGRIVLKDIKFYMNDSVSRMKITVNAQDFQTGLTSIRITKNIYKIQKARLEGIHVDMASWAEPTLDNQTDRLAAVQRPQVGGKVTTDLPEIAARQIEVYQSSYQMRDHLSGQSFIVRLEEFIGKPEHIDLNEQIIDLNKISLKKAYAHFKAARNVASDTTTNTATDTPQQGITFPDIGWKMAADNFEIQQTNFYFDQPGPDSVKAGIDPNHIAIENLQLSLDDFEWNAQKIQVELNKLVFKERSGFVLNNFETTFLFDTTQVSLKDLHFETPYTELHLEALVQYPSLENILQRPEDSQIDFTVNDSRLSIQEIKVLAPELLENPSIAKIQSQQFTLDAQMKVSLKKLIIDHLDFTGFQKTELHLEGFVENLLGEISDYAGEVNLQLASAASDLKPFVPAGTNITIPEEISLELQGAGNIHNFNADLSLKTTLGQIMAEAKSNAGNYELLSQIQQLQLGRLLSNPALQILTSQINIKGKGMDIEKDLRAQLNVKVQEAGYNGVSYNDIEIHGNIDRKSFEGTIHSRDTTLLLEGNAHIDFNRAEPTYLLAMVMERVDLYALKFSEKPFTFRSRLELEGQGASANNFDALLKIDSLLIIGEENRRLPINFIKLGAQAHQDSTHVKLESDIVNTELTGKFQLNTLPNILLAHTNRYFQWQQKPLAQNLPPASFDITMQIKNQSIVWQTFLPALEVFQINELKGHYNSEKYEIDLKLFSSRIVYGSQSLQGLNLDIHGDSTQLAYALNIESLGLSEDNYISGISLNGQAADNLLQLNIEQGEDNKKEYALGLNLKKDSLDKQVYTLHFDPELRIQKEVWTLPEDNNLRYGPKVLEANNFTLEHEGQQIVLATPQYGDIELSIQDLKLGYVMDKVRKSKEKDTLLNGLMEAKVLAKNIFNTPNLEANLDVQNLRVKNIGLGDLNIKADNQQNPTHYNAEISLKGTGNDLNIKGIYKSEDKKSPLYFKATLNELAMKTMEAFSMGSLAASKGALKGEVTVAGLPGEPRLEGQMHFEGAEFRVTSLNNRFTLPSEEIVFDAQGIHFQKFTIQDSTQKTIVIQGDVLTQTYRTFDLNLAVEAEDFIFLNSTKNDNETFYGLLVADTRLKISGKATKPVVNASLGLHKNTNFTYVYIQSGAASIQKSDDVVKFASVGPVLVDTSQAQQIKGFEGIDLNASIEVEKGAQFQLLLEPYTEDGVKVKGGGNLQLQMNPQGDLNLTGRYDIDGGQYKLTLYEVIRKDFQIQEGSAITWNGEPAKPEIKLRAKYIVETSAVNLVPSVTENAALRIDQEYWVFLNLDGPALTPAIDFDLEYPDNNEVRRNTGNEAIQSKIQSIKNDESELNKQVFALLVLGTFLADNFSETQMGGSGGVNWRGNVASIIEGQFNKLTNKYIKGVEVDVDYESYDQAGADGNVQQSENVNVNLRKNLFNERLSVSVGSSFSLDNNQNSSNTVNSAAQQQQAQQAADVVIEYKITKDGRYRLRVFNVQEQSKTATRVNNSGVSILFTEDFNRYRDLLKKKKEREKKNSIIQEKDNKQLDNIQ